MGRSSGASCFKIIACGGGDSVDRDDLDAAESKGADKHGWSFRKRSASHRVLSNTVITETASSGNKQTPEITTVSFQAPAKSTISEKTSEIYKAAIKDDTLVTEAAIEDGTLVAQSDTKNDTLVTQSTTKDDTLVTQFATEDDTLEAQSATRNDSLVTQSAIKDDTLVAQSATKDDSLVTQSAIKYDFLVTQSATKDDILVTQYASNDATLVAQSATEDDTLVTKAATEDDTLVTEVTETVTGNGTSIGVNPDESAIVIQSAVRKFLAQRELLKHKKVVRLQAVVRGHLVRRHAVGTLRCVQAIVKMQALVRARQAHLSPERKHGNADYDMKPTEMKSSGTKQHPTYVSIEKLIGNSFARQLLESTPKTKQINLKLDPSKSDSAWKWLERWMSASAIEDELDSKSEANTEFEEHDEFINHPEDQVEQVIPSQDKPTAVKLDADESDGTALTNQTVLIELDSLSDKPVLEADEPNRSMKRLAPEPADSDGRKFVFGSRKASSPAFIAAQSKFEELTSTSITSKSFNSSNQNHGVDSCADSVTSSSHDNSIKTREVDLSENSVSHNSKVHVGGSECGTELSISSTLDSPDQSEIENVEKESIVLEEHIGNPTDNLNAEENLEQTILGTELTHSISVPTESLDSVIDTNGDRPQDEFKLEDNAFNAPTNPEPETCHQVYKSSPEASPRSHMTVPESQGTPASQISTSTKKGRSDKKGSSQKRKSLSANKRSPISTGRDSGLRSSMDQLPKDNKLAKRRTSFGSPRPDHFDQEPRDSSINNSLPSYMQATESAKAKALAANGSPRSSPDVHDKESLIKKRHSPAAKQTTKGNNTNERKWQR